MAKKATKRKANGGLPPHAAQHEAEQFLYRQAELLDGKNWQGWIDLFTPDGIYWMPPEPSHKTWEGMPAIFAGSTKSNTCLNSPA